MNGSCRTRPELMGLRRPVGVVPTLGVLLLLAPLCAALALPTPSAMAAANRRGEWRKTLDLFESWAASQPASSSQPAGTAAASSCYTEAMRAHSRLGSGEAALDVFHRMQASGITPGLLAYTIVMRACATAKLWPVALSLYADMCEADGVRVDTVACNSVLVACERGGQLEEAELILRDMQAR